MTGATVRWRSFAGTRTGPPFGELARLRVGKERALDLGNVAALDADLRAALVPGRRGHRHAGPATIFQVSAS